VSIRLVDSESGLSEYKTSDLESGLSEHKTS
jgi:hypothetical protein